MIPSVKVRCLKCGHSSYIRGDHAADIVPDGIEKDEAFRAFCPFCDENMFVVIVE